MGTCLSLFRSYLSGLTQFVQLQNFLSKPSQVTAGVYQGSVLFIIYLLSLGHIFRKYNIHFHCYAKLYLSSIPLSSAFSVQLFSWFSSNFLKLNSGKTEILQVGTKSTLAKSDSFSVTVDQSTVFSSMQVKSLGVVLDSSIFLKPR